MIKPGPRGLTDKLSKITYPCFRHTRVFCSGARFSFHASSKSPEAIKIIFAAFSARWLILWLEITGLTRSVLAWKLTSSLFVMVHTARKNRAFHVQSKLSDTDEKNF